jgi:drug/metabolite transporter (DMT)-like permease
VTLDPTLVALVLLAALCHASWNAVVKSDRDRLASFGLVMLAGSILGLAALPFAPAPAPRSWPYLTASMLTHNFYYFFLLRSYAHGDLGHVYPIARGLGPLIVATLSGRLAGEYLTTPEAVGVALVSGGIASLAFGGGWPRGHEWRPVLYAVGTGIAISGYTLVDGLGVRQSDAPLGYIVWLNILEGPWVFLAAIWYRRAALIPYLRTQWWRGAAGGVVATIAYAIAVWAMSRGALANVAALRETSVLFAAVMGTVLLHERFGWRRIGAAVLVVAGLLLMNLPLS